MKMNDVYEGMVVTYPSRPRHNPTDVRIIKGRVLYRVRDHSSVFINDLIICPMEDYDKLRPYAFMELISHGMEREFDTYNFVDIEDVIFHDVPNSTYKNTLERL